MPPHSTREAPGIPEAGKRAEKFPAAPAVDKKQEVETVKVNAQRATVIDERRESTAAKLIVGRDEIEKFADSALVDVMRRLPGITESNSGAVSLRGMGAGFTQILIDSEQFTIQPFVSKSQFNYTGKSTLVQFVGTSPVPYATNDNLFAAQVARIHLPKPFRIPTPSFRAARPHGRSTPTPYGTCPPPASCV